MCTKVTSIAILNNKSRFNLFTTTVKFQANSSKVNLMCTKVTSVAILNNKLKFNLFRTTVKFQAKSSKVNLMCTKVTLFIFPVAILKMMKYNKVRIKYLEAFLVTPLNGTYLKVQVQQSLAYTPQREAKFFNKYLSMAQVYIDSSYNIHLIKEIVLTHTSRQINHLVYNYMFIKNVGIQIAITKLIFLHNDVSVHPCYLDYLDNWHLFLYGDSLDNWTCLIIL